MASTSACRRPDDDLGPRPWPDVRGHADRAASGSEGGQQPAQPGVGATTRAGCRDTLVGRSPAPWTVTGYGCGRASTGSSRWPQAVCPKAERTSRASGRSRRGRSTGRALCTSAAVHARRRTRPCRSCAPASSDSSGAGASSTTSARAGGRQGQRERERRQSRSGEGHPARGAGRAARSSSRASSRRSTLSSAGEGSRCRTDRCPPGRAPDLGETVLLCWQLGECKVAHWHGAEEGFAGGKPLPF